MSLPRRPGNPWLSLSLTVLVVLAACSSGEVLEEPAQDGGAEMALADRLALIDETVEAWAQAETIEDAHRLAETAANLVVGPGGPQYGDRDGDGKLDGASSDGLLPGLGGSPPGLAIWAESNTCVERDVLGGSWDDPDARWQTMIDAIEAWEPGNNTMPTLPSHPMRVVGWATFTIGTDSLELAHEFAGHARLHSGLSLKALDC